MPRPFFFIPLCYETRTGQDIRHAETLLGLHGVPSRAAGDHPLRPGGPRHAGADAHGRREIAHVSGSDPRPRGAVHRRHAAHRPDEGPGRPAPGAGRPGRCDPFGPFAAADRHRAGQLRLRRREIPLRGPRAAGDRGVPPARRAHERTADRRRRGPLHLAVGLRLPALVPAHRRAARKTPRRPRAGAHRLGHENSGRRHHAPPEIPRTAHSAQQFRAPQPLVQRPPHRRQERTAAAAGPQRPRHGHRLRPHAGGHRADRRPPASGGHDGRRLPRRTGTRRAVAAAGGVALGQDARDGGHQRLRHGHRQSGRAVRGPLCDVRLARKLLPGGRPRGPRLTACLCPAARGLGRQRPHRAAFRAGVPSAGEDQGDLRTDLFLPANRHRRRRRSVVPVQHTRLLRPRAPLFGDRHERPETAPAERLHDPHRRTGEPRAGNVLRQPRRAVQTPRAARRTRPLHPHPAAALQRRLHRVPPHRRGRTGHLERLHRPAGQGAAQTALAAARDPLHPLEPLAHPLYERGTPSARRPLHSPRDL